MDAGKAGTGSDALGVELAAAGFGAILLPVAARPDTAGGVVLTIRRLPEGLRHLRVTTTGRAAPGGRHRLEFEADTAAAGGIALTAGSRLDGVDAVSVLSGTVDLRAVALPAGVALAVDGTAVLTLRQVAQAAALTSPSGLGQVLVLLEDAAAVEELGRLLARPGNMLSGFPAWSVLRQP